MMSKHILIVFVAIISLAVHVKGSKYNKQVRNTCPLATLDQLLEYQSITKEITTTSCNLSITSNFGKGGVYQHSASSLATNNSNLIFLSLNPTCRRYTDALALKFQLQKVLFNNNETLSNKTLLQVTSLIINLQTAAKKLQDIAVKLHERCCVTFTSTQYELIYFLRLHKEDIAKSLCERARIWQVKNEVCTNWTIYD